MKIIHQNFKGHEIREGKYKEEKHEIPSNFLNNLKNTNCMNIYINEFRKLIIKN